VTFDKLLSRFPFWPNSVWNDQFSHQRSECFVEPQVVPPLHGDDISEPHVGKFVALNGCDSLLGGQGTFLWVVDVGGSSSSDQTPVLHGSSIEIVCDKGVEFRQSVGNVEDFFVDWQSPFLDIKTELSVLDEIGSSKDL
jgi:hypothetical protein